MTTGPRERRKRASEPVRIVRKLAREVGSLAFGPPVTHVYNPLDYARAPCEEYLSRYARPGVGTLFLGMNPGPFGMAQTGVPFGEVAAVRDWLGIEAAVRTPRNEHPKRRVTGFACTRSEVSGRRVWSWARDRFGTPEKFFARFFVWNYCPLVFMEDSGRNRTPDKLSREERAVLFDVCDRALRAMVAHLAPERVLGVGRFAEERARRVLEGSGLTVGGILHPSPASPVANRGWAERAEADLAALGVELGPATR